MWHVPCTGNGYILLSPAVTRALADTTDSVLELASILHSLNDLSIL